MENSHSSECDMLLFKSNACGVCAELFSFLGPNQVVVKLKNVGICGSDVHYWVNT